MAQYATGLDTRQRLLQAGAEVFAELGYRHTKLSDICQRAGTNAAAVNYHFGDKEQLYLEVVRWAHEQKDSCAYRSIDPDAPAEVRLRQFVSEFLESTLDPSRPGWLGMLMAREMVEPTKALDFIVENAVKPTLDAVEGIVRDLLGPEADPELVKRSSTSIIGQCALYPNSRTVIPLLDPEFRFERATLEALAEHITRFSLAALRSLAAEVERAGDGCLPEQAGR